MHVHTVLASTTHNRWNRKLPPVITVDSGDIIDFETRSSDDGQVQLHDPKPPADPSRVHPLSGPVAVRGAQPGDALRIDIIDVKTADWGWQLVSHDRGLLKGVIPKTEVLIVAVDHASGTIRYPSGATAPLRPFPGIVGVAPAEDGEFRTLAPGVHGGNIDVAELVAGTTLFLPVLTPSGLLSIGDVHASQGDGEVCLTGVETAGWVRVRVTVLQNASVRGPQMKTPSHFGLLETGSTIDEACRKALQAAVTFLSENADISAAEAYAICSGAADLRINQVVNGGAIGARVMIPLTVLSSLGVQV